MKPSPLSRILSFVTTVVFLYAFLVILKALMD
jgi:hypothetical protein